MIHEERLLKIIKAPHISEKSSYGSEENRQYAFEILKDATKVELKKAVEHLFNVKVKSVRVCNMKGKQTRFGKIQGRRKDCKKAYVTLAEGHEIEMSGAEG